MYGLSTITMAFFFFFECIGRVNMLPGLSWMVMQLITWLFRPIVWNLIWKISKTSINSSKRMVIIWILKVEFWKVHDTASLVIWYCMFWSSIVNNYYLAKIWAPELIYLIISLSVSPDGLLLQSSTLADSICFEFSDGMTTSVPCSYIEFAERLVLPQYKHLPETEVRKLAPFTGRFMLSLPCVSLAVKNHP